MLESFNELEAIEVGLNLEKEGYEFYHAAAAQAANAETAARFRQMALEEKKHFERFNRYREQLSSDGDIGEETVSYLKHLIQMGIFTEEGSLADQLKDVTDEKQVISLAIGAEKDSLLFFHEAAQNSSSQRGKEIFEWLIVEERKHLELLGEMFKRLL